MSNLTKLLKQNDFSFGKKIPNKFFFFFPQLALLNFIPLKYLKRDDKRLRMIPFLYRYFSPLQYSKQAYSYTQVKIKLDFRNIKSQPQSIYIKFKTYSIHPAFTDSQSCTLKIFLSYNSRKHQKNESQDLNQLAAPKQYSNFNHLNNKPLNELIVSYTKLYY